MAGDAIILVTSGAVWRVELDPSARPEEISAAIRDALGSGGGGEVVVAIPSAWCFAAHVDCAGRNGGDRKTLLFRLEEKLPLAAEEIVADFINEPSRNRALAVAARVEQLRPLIAAIETAGVAVRCVSPLALLAVQQIAGDDEDPVIELWPEGDRVNVTARRGGRVTAWSLVSEHDGAGVQRAVDVHAMSFDGAPDALRRGQLEEAAVGFARTILAGRSRPAVELRRGPLAAADSLRPHRRSLNFALAAAAAFLVLLTGAMLVRAQRYERVVAAYERQLKDEFSRALPDWTPPPNVRAVIDSEYRKAQSRLPDSASPAGANASALRTLHEVLSRFPSQGRCDIDHLNFSEGSFELNGRVRSLEDVEPLATAAREAGLEVPPPVTRRGEDGSWTFTLRGSKPQAGVAMAGRP